MPLPESPDSRVLTTIIAIVMMVVGAGVLALNLYRRDLVGITISMIVIGRGAIMKGTGW